MRSWEERRRLNGAASGILAKIGVTGWLTTKNACAITVVEDAAVVIQAGLDRGLLRQIPQLHEAIV